MKGVPLRLEIGPRDIENNQCVLVDRVNREKTMVPLDSLEDNIAARLQQVHDALYSKALARREQMTYPAATLEELIDTAQHKPGFIKAMWCGERACEDRLKELAGVTTRCMPFEQERLADTCVCCGQKAEKMVVFGKAY